MWSRYQLIDIDMIWNWTKYIYVDFLLLISFNYVSKYNFYGVACFIEYSVLKAAVVQLIGW